MNRQAHEQKALDLVAGRKADQPAVKSARNSLGALEMMGILLWLLVIAGGGGAAVYFLVLAPK